MNDAHDNAQDDRDALEKHTPDMDPLACPIVPGDRWNGTAGGPTPPDPELTHFDGMTGEVLDEDAPAGSGWDKERHCATDLRGADWAGRKLREAQEQMALNWTAHQANLAAIHAECDRKIAAAEKWHAASDAPFIQTAEYMENVLRVFASTPEGKAEVLKGLRKKSRLLPSGVTIGWEKKGGHLRLQEAPDAREKLIRWARLHCPDATEQRWEVDAAAAKKHYAKTFGRVGAPDGMERVPESEELYVSTGVEQKEEP